eukprot:Nitzschia sp. Nitz4//scaffold4_size323378//129187//130080//NITZ4_000652-RA/size323378-snap-gene-0.413-mRNA-1//1//CDS//3329553375//76//frame0
MQSSGTSFEVYVAKDDFKFHAAHFVAFEGYRERLHGHNYRVGVRVLGSRKISSDGYVIDFGNIKQITRRVCKELNEHFLCPMYSNVMDITVLVPVGEEKEVVTLKCQDGSTFQFPRDDCALLPIVHATAEELAIYLWSRILDGLNSEWLRRRGVHTLEVVVTEAVGQEATFRLAIPENAEGQGSIDVRSFIMEGKMEPMPCPSQPLEIDEKKKGCQGKCPGCSQSLQQQLEKLASALNSKKLTQDEIVTVDDLKEMVGEVDSTSS